jgi:hypothetical protein
MLPTDQLKGSDPISFKFFNLNWIRPLFTDPFSLPISFKFFGN